MLDFLLTKTNYLRYALKMLKNFIIDKTEIEEYLNEIEFLKKYKNKYILNYIEHFLDSNRLCIITTYYKVKTNDFIISSFNFI